MTRLLSEEQVNAINARNRPRVVKPMGVQREVVKKLGRPPKPKKPKKPKVPALYEHVEQRMVVQWWADNCKRFGLDERLLFAIPNGSNKSAAAAMKFKLEGLRSGVPDLMFAKPYASRHLGLGNFWHHGLMIEMKRTKGSTVSPEQTEYHALLTAQGYRVVVAYGHLAAISAIEQYLGAA